MCRPARALLKYLTPRSCRHETQVFKCPPSFRVFAAQNPLREGGGRKGLPRSFLNRFTRVSIESMGNADLEAVRAPGLGLTCPAYDACLPCLRARLIRSQCVLSYVLHTGQTERRNIENAPQRTVASAGVPGLASRLHAAHMHCAKRWNLPDRILDRCAPRSTPVCLQHVVQPWSHSTKHWRVLLSLIAALAGLARHGSSTCVMFCAGASWRSGL